jgi:hypothetical protein
VRHLASHGQTRRISTAKRPSIHPFVASRAFWSRRCLADFPVLIRSVPIWITSGSPTIRESSDGGPNCNTEARWPQKQALSSRAFKSRWLRWWQFAFQVLRSRTGGLVWQPPLKLSARTRNFQLVLGYTRATWVEGSSAGVRTAG